MELGIEEIYPSGGESPKALHDGNSRGPLRGNETQKHCFTSKKYVFIGGSCALVTLLGIGAAVLWYFGLLLSPHSSQGNSSSTKTYSAVFSNCSLLTSCSSYTESFYTMDSMYVTASDLNMKVIQSYCLQSPSIEATFYPVSLTETSLQSTVSKTIKWTATCAASSNEGRVEYHVLLPVLNPGKWVLTLSLSIENEKELIIGNFSVRLRSEEHPALLTPFTDLVHQSATVETGLKQFLSIAFHNTSVAVDQLGLNAMIFNLSTLFSTNGRSLSLSSALSSTDAVIIAEYCGYFQQILTQLPHSASGRQLESYYSKHIRHGKPSLLAADPLQVMVKIFMLDLTMTGVSVATVKACLRIPELATADSVLFLVPIASFLVFANEVRKDAVQMLGLAVRIRNSAESNSDGRRLAASRTYPPIRLYCGKNQLILPNEVQNACFADGSELCQLLPTSCLVISDGWKMIVSMIDSWMDLAETFSSTNWIISGITDKLTSFKKQVQPLFNPPSLFWSEDDTTHVMMSVSSSDPRCQAASTVQVNDGKLEIDCNCVNPPSLPYTTGFTLTIKAGTTADELPVHYEVHADLIDLMPTSQPTTMIPAYVKRGTNTFLLSNCVPSSLEDTSCNFCFYESRNCRFQVENDGTASVRCNGITPDSYARDFTCRNIYDASTGSITHREYGIPDTTRYWGIQMLMPASDFGDHKAFTVNYPVMIIYNSIPGYTWCVAVAGKWKGVRYVYRDTPDPSIADVPCGVPGFN